MLAMRLAAARKPVLLLRRLVGGVHGCTSRAFPATTHGFATCLPLAGWLDLKGFGLSTESLTVRLTIFAVLTGDLHGVIAGTESNPAKQLG